MPLNNINMLLLQDEKMLMWYSKDREKRLNLSSVSSVVLGHKTVCGFHFSSTLLFFVHSTSLRIEHVHFLRILVFYRQNFYVCIGQKRNPTHCQSSTRMVNVHLTWYFYSLGLLFRLCKFYPSHYYLP